MMTTTRPTWTSLTHEQKVAAFCMNQDNFEQSGLSMESEWNEFMDCFDESEWAETWASLNEQAAFQAGNAETVAEFRACARRHR
jgi:hypothetical protein